MSCQCAMSTSTLITGSQLEHMDCEKFLLWQSQKEKKSTCLQEQTDEGNSVRKVRVWHR